ncbi:hypothetical protein GGI07_002864 [Coemansia sp. Benny D115]|nr:hypothetical protein GGI07_002864 [Coemansia sp. Benny D115]
MVVSSRQQQQQQQQHPLQRASTMPGALQQATAPNSHTPLPLRALGKRRTIPVGPDSGRAGPLSLSTTWIRTQSISLDDTAEPPPPTPMPLTLGRPPPPMLSLPHAHAVPGDCGGGGGGDAALARRAAKTYRNGPQLIMPYLFLGGEASAQDVQLRRLGIMRVLNVAREVTTSTDDSTGIERRHYAWDHNEADVERCFAECFAFIDQARQRHEGVLVHCQLGVSRSATLAIAYVMRTMALGFADAYEYVRLRAPCISPNLSLIVQLSAYDRRRGGLLMDVPGLTSGEDESASSAGSSPTDPPDEHCPAGPALDGLCMHAAQQQHTFS